MTVEKLDYKENYMGNDVTLVFPFNVNYYQDSSIEVYLDGEKQSGGYVIDKVNNPVEGDISESISIIFDTPPADGVEVNLVRKTPNLQPLDFVNGAKLRAETLERGFDLIVMMIQELLGNIGNSLRLEHFSDDGSLLIIKQTAEERKGTVLVFDDETGEITVVPIDGFPKGDKGDKGDDGDSIVDLGSIGLPQLADGIANNVLGFDALDNPVMFKVNTENIAAGAVGLDELAELVIPIGVEQTWHNYDLVTEREDGVIYFNDTGRPLQWFLTMESAGDYLGSTVQVWKIVTPGAGYGTAPGVTILDWEELRKTKSEEV